MFRSRVLYINACVLSRKGPVPARRIMHRHSELIEVLEGSRNLLAGSKLHGDLGRRRWRGHFSHKYVDQIWCGIQHAPLQFYCFVLRGDMRQIADWRMALGAMPIAVEERGAFLRITR